jgi:hypothetical protein
MRRALEIDEKSYGPNHSNVVIHLNNLAVWHKPHVGRIPASVPGIGSFAFGQMRRLDGLAESSRSFSVTILVRM